MCAHAREALGLTRKIPRRSAKRAKWDPEGWASSCTSEIRRKAEKIKLGRVGVLVLKRQTGIFVLTLRSSVLQQQVLGWRWFLEKQESEGL